MPDTRDAERQAGSVLEALAAMPDAIVGEGTRSVRQIRTAAAIHTGYSALTDYPLGIVKAIPYQAHLALDVLGAVAVAATPFVTGQHKKGPKQWVPHVALALFELSSLAVSDPTGHGDYHGDVDAVRRANSEDPRRNVYNGKPAVRPAAAAT